MAEKSFGEWLKRQRKAAGLTQDQLAAQISCSTITLRKIEAEERRPSLQIAERLAQIFEIPANEQKAFLRFARGSLASAPKETVKDSPWDIPSQPPRVNLPATVTSLIGREQDIEQVHGYLAKKDVRLVTLLGPPGIGKTRLSLESARNAAFHFPDGVFFVALAPLDDPSLIAPAIAQTLGYVEAGNLSTDKLLTDGIGNKTMLLILDNCEHLIEKVAPLASGLLLACPHLKILATSREALRVPGEWLYPVPALELPQQNSPLSLDKASNFPALTLFAERARAVRPDFKLTPENIATVAKICTQLDGLPLAIELIAARIRIMSPQMLLEKMTGQFILSADGMRAVDARQKTLNNAIGWSYDFLAAEEQKAFDSLAVFSGGFTLEASEAILSPFVKEKPAFDIINSLADKSLLQRSIDAQDQPHYLMLDTIQQFALERLRRSGKEAEVRNTHLAYFLDLAETGDREMHGPGQLEWTDRLRNEHDNIRTALEWAISKGKEEIVLRLTGALFWFWDRSGSLIEGRIWMERALAAPQSEPVAMHAKVLYGAAYLARAQGDFVHAHKYIEQSVREWSKLGRDGKHGLSLAKVWLAGLIREEGDPAKARDLIEECIAFFRERGDLWALAWSLMYLGLAIRDQDDHALAWSTIQESVKFWREQGDLWGLAEALHSLALVAYRRPDYGAAYSITEEALLIQQRLGDKQKIAYLVHNLGVFSLAQGEQERAIQFFEKDLTLFEEVGDKSGIVLALQYQGLCSRFKGDLEQAQIFYKKGLILVGETGPKWVASNYFLWLADLAATRGKMERVVRLCSAARANLSASASFWDEFERSHYERVVSLAHDALDERTFAVAQSEGSAMSLEKAIAYALQENL